MCFAKYDLACMKHPASVQGGESWCMCELVVVHLRSNAAPSCNKGLHSEKQQAGTGRLTVPPAVSLYKTDDMPRCVQSRGATVLFIRAQSVRAHVSVPHLLYTLWATAPAQLAHIQQHKQAMTNSCAQSVPVCSMACCLSQ